MNPYNEGWLAFNDGKSVDDNPYDFETDFANADNWLNGYVDSEMNS